MSCNVEIADPARDDIDDAVAFIAQSSTVAARKWKTAGPHFIAARDTGPVCGHCRSWGAWDPLPQRPSSFPSRHLPHSQGEEHGLCGACLSQGERRPLSHEDIDPQDET